MSCQGPRSSGSGATRAWFSSLSPSVLQQNWAFPTSSNKPCSFCLWAKAHGFSMPGRFYINHILFPPHSQHFAWLPVTCSSEPSSPLKCLFWPQRPIILFTQPPISRTHVQFSVSHLTVNSLNSRTTSVNFWSLKPCIDDTWIMTAWFNIGVTNFFFCKWPDR